VNSEDGGLRLGTLFGFPVLIHQSFLGIAPAAGLFVLISGSTSGMLNGFILLAVILFSVVVHEVSHALAARALGIPVQHIMLTWYGGYARFWVRPSNRLQEVSIALAGPFANLALSAIAFLFLEMLPPTSNLSGEGSQMLISFREVSPFEYALRAIAWANLGLGAFNLLPGLPLDGGHVLRSALSLAMPRGRAGSIAAWTGLWVGLATIAGGFRFESLWTIAIGVSLALSAWAMLQSRTFA
jgi:Zn-dependent protease